MRTLVSILAIALVLPTSSALAQASIEGYAISLDTGRPIEGAQIVLRNEEGIEIGGYGTITTNAEGYYLIPDLDPGRYTLHAASGYSHDGDSLRYVLVSDAFAVMDTTKHVHFGFWKLSIAVNNDVSEAMQKLRGVQHSPRSSVRYDSFPEQLFARAALIESSIQTGQGEDIFNIDYQEPVRNTR
jgi:hypothetical protein